MIYNSAGKCLVEYSMSLNVHPIVSVPFEENSYILWRTGNRSALVVDPGLEPDLILDFLNRMKLIPAAILNTHGHADHIAGNQALKDAYPEAPLIIGAGDVELLSDPNLNLSAPFGFSIFSPPADRLVIEGDSLDLADISLKVLEIPGHSPGHVVFVHAGPPPIVLGGDVLFQGSVGRTDFPGGSADRLYDGIRKKLFVLGDDTVVYPGHGPATTVGHEKRTNPFIGD